MSEPSESPLTGTNNRPDPELVELPAPRRPYRLLTLACLVLTAVGSLGFVWNLRGELGYCLSTTLRELGALESVRLQPTEANHWVRGEGELAEIGGIRYSRPLEADSFRLAPLSGNSKLWVQVRVPAGFEDTHFVAPTIFSGRLVPFASLGLRYSALGEAPADAGWQPGHLPKDAWLLIDGETPRSCRWIVGLAGMFAAYCAFALWALVALLKPLPKPKLESSR